MFQRNLVYTGSGLEKRRKQKAKIWSTERVFKVWIRKTEEKEARNDNCSRRLIGVKCPKESGVDSILTTTDWFVLGKCLSRGGVVVVERADRWMDGQTRQGE